MAKKKRTTLRSASGKKLYAIRDDAGQFEDIQSYQQAHAQDIKRVSKAESAEKALNAVTKSPPKKKTSKKLAKKSAPKKAVAKKASAKK